MPQALCVIHHVYYSILEKVKLEEWRVILKQMAAETKIPYKLAKNLEWGVKVDNWENIEKVAKAEKMKWSPKFHGLNLCGIKINTGAPNTELRAALESSLRSFIYFFSAFCGLPSPKENA